MDETKERKVLVAMDGSRFADYAFEFYMQNVYKDKDYVILFHCIELGRLMSLPPDFGSVSLMESVVQDEKKQAKVYLEKLTEIMEKHNLNGKVEQIYGSPRTEILRAAEEEKVELVVTGSRGMGHFGRAMIGSVSDYVLHHSHVPVLICRHVDDYHHRGSK